MNTNTYLLPETTDPSRWESALYAFLAEKQRRTGSMRTVQSYSRILRYCFVRIQKTPDQVTSAEVMGFCFGKGISGREPTAVTIGSRIATISSFYHFLIRMEMLNANPCDALLAVIPDTVPGRRDRAIVLTLILTGRRRSEVLNLSARDIEVADERTYYTYRGKGGKQGRRELPRPAVVEIGATLADAGKCIATIAPDESLWSISQPTAYARFRKYLVTAGLPPTGFHILRHSAAKLRRDAGDTVESVSQFLDHSSLAVTTVYLRRLEVAEEVAGAGWPRR